jgi:membrane-bound lytic murein transglycosylase D
MSIRIHSVFTIAMLVAVAAQGVLKPAAADLELVPSSTGPEAGAAPAPSDLSRRESSPSPLLQQPTEEAGSSATSAPVGPAAEPAAVEAVSAPPPLESPAPPPAEALVIPPVEISGEYDPYSVVVNDRVQFFMDRYTGSRRDVVGLWLSRSPRYLTMIRDAFRAQGLPEDLAFVAMIESGFNPRAVSRVGAKGLWQFMAPTARGYGLRVDKWVDDRLDPVKSTHAAAAHMRDLYRHFGSWPLVKAAYNAGGGKVARAIQGTGTTDFWVLARSRYLRQETKDFVPAIHAATLIGRDPGHYGFEQGIVEEMLTVTVSVPPRTSLKTLSTRSGIPFEILRDLNPVLIRAMTPPGASYALTVPDGSVTRVEAALAPPRGIHVVKSNETVTVIAKRYGVTVAEVLRWNHLDERSVIRPGDRLRVLQLQITAERGKTDRSR